METGKVTLFFFLCGILQCIKAACFSSSSAVAPPALFRFGHARYTGLRLEAIVDLWFRLRRSAPEQRDSVGKRSAKIWIIFRRCFMFIFSSPPHGPRNFQGAEKRRFC